MNIMKNLLLRNLLFYWGISFFLAVLVYYALWLIIPEHYVFGTFIKMPAYHWEYPIAYIAIPCFFYGIFATIFTKKFIKLAIWGQVLITFAIAILTIVASSPFGGMLWHYHNMKAGYFPANWADIIFKDGFIHGIMLGWLIILLSIPYNVIGLIISYFIIKKRANLFYRKSK